MIRILVWSIAIFFFSCRTAAFRKDLHEEYGKKLVDAGLEKTALGRQWFDAASKALEQPLRITVPYKETGYFSAEKPRAAGLAFLVKRGQKIFFRVQKNPASNFALYIDLWQKNPGKPSLITSLDTSKSSFEFEVEEDQELLLRIQPELLKSCDYTLSVSVGPSIGFPVSERVGKIGSFWGDDRDAGSRSHEGIDIFAPKRTPAVAAADGRINSVTENNLGGKVIFMRPSGKDYTLYYAHLDEQMATDGQMVKKGDTIGLVGNTGNARTTAPHLHFGIYAYGGAIDPLPFVDPVVKNPADPSFSSRELYGYYRLNKTSFLTLPDGQASMVQQENTLIKPIAAFGRTILAELPDRTMVTINVNLLEPAQNALKKLRTANSWSLLELPSPTSPRKLTSRTSTEASVYAYFNGYAYLKIKDEEGWIEQKMLQ